MSSLASIGLGSNLGDRRACAGGCDRRPGPDARCERPHHVSSFHETEPVGGPPGQGNYLNAAAVLETTLDPFAVLRLLQEIEAQFGRVRTVRGASGPWTSTCSSSTIGSSTRPNWSCPTRGTRPDDSSWSRWPRSAPGAVDPVTKQTVAEPLSPPG